MRLSLHQLKAFRAVFQAGSMTAAAALTGVTVCVGRSLPSVRYELKIV